MYNLELDENLDIKIADGMASFVVGADDIIQSIRTELQQNKGQWLLNEYFGVPWLDLQNEGILQKKDNYNRLLIEMSQVIKKYDIDKIEGFEYIDNGTFIIKVKIKGEIKEVIL